MRERAAGRGLFQLHFKRTDGDFPLWPDFRGGAEKYGDRRSDGCDRAGRSDSGASGDSVDAELCRAGEKQVDVQYTADLCDLSAGTGAGMDRKPLS